MTKISPPKKLRWSVTIKFFSDDLETDEKFNEFFKNAVNNLNLSSNEDLLLSTTHLSDPVQIDTEKYKNHPSILTI